jgi:hypothetical protein
MREIKEDIMGKKEIVDYLGRIKWIKRIWSWW